MDWQNGNINILSQVKLKGLRQKGQFIYSCVYLYMLLVYRQLFLIIHSFVQMYFMLDCEKISHGQTNNCLFLNSPLSAQKEPPESPSSIFSPRAVVWHAGVLGIPCAIRMVRDVHVDTTQSAVIHRSRPNCQVLRTSWLPQAKLPGRW